MVDIQPTTTQPISDDQELAKVLAGVNQQADDALQFEETPAPIPAPVAEPVADPVVPADVTPPIDSGLPVVGRRSRTH